MALFPSGVMILLTCVLEAYDTRNLGARRVANGRRGPDFIGLNRACANTHVQHTSKCGTEWFFSEAKRAM